MSKEIVFLHQWKDGESSFWGPPNIEKILDTALTNENERFYKVKWGKVTWEREEQLFQDVINQFWMNRQNCHGPISSGDHATESNADSITNEKTACSPVEVVPGLVENHSQQTTDAKTSGNQTSVHHSVAKLTCNSTPVTINLMSKTSNEHTVDTRSFKEQQKNHCVRKKCQICGKEFQRLLHLQTHVLTHTGSRPWSCSTCNKAFTDKSSLIKHEKIHCGVLAFQCDVCSKRFLHRYQLRRHNEIHLGVKHFPCEKCGKRFNQKCTLKTHLNTHTGQKPYMCTTCNQSFADNATLRRHVVVHSKEKLHQCDFCSKAFSRSSTLAVHKKIHDAV